MTSNLPEITRGSTQSNLVVVKQDHRVISTQNRALPTAKPVQQDGVKNYHEAVVTHKSEQELLVGTHNQEVKVDNLKLKVTGQAVIVPQNPCSQYWYGVDCANIPHSHNNTLYRATYPPCSARPYDNSSQYNSKMPVLGWFFTWIGCFLCWSPIGLFLTLPLWFGWSYILCYVMSTNHSKNSNLFWLFSIPTSREFQHTLSPGLNNQFIELTLDEYKMKSTNFGVLSRHELLLLGREEFSIEELAKFEVLFYNEVWYRTFIRNPIRFAVFFVVWFTLSLPVGAYAITALY